MDRRARWVLSLVVPALTAAGLAAQTGTAAPWPYHHFWSRPDLRPPAVHVLRRVPGTSAGYIFIAPKRRAPQAGPMIIDDGGKVIWYRPLTTRGVMGFRVQRYRGRPVLTWWHAKAAAAKIGTAAYTIADQFYGTVAEVRPGNGAIADPHEILITRQGTALMTTFRNVQIGDRRVADGGVQEMDLRTGRVLLDWRASRHVAFSESYTKVPRHKDFPYDFFHVNSIAVLPDGNLLVSARNTHTVYKINRHTGAIIWRLGGKRSDFSLGRGVRFAWQHDARARPDGTISIFDNGAAPRVHRQSRVIFVRLDLRRMLATLVRYVVHRPPRLAINQGNAQLLPQGHVLVGWGREHFLTEFDADGRALLDLQFGGDIDSYRAFRFGWRGRPRTRPAVALHNGRIFVSWNGATDVLRWQFLAGRTKAELHPIRTVRKVEFEQSTAAPRHSWLLVRAIGPKDRTLGWSPFIRSD
jgi:Arylsulfotransferase (ASST)